VQPAQLLPAGTPSRKITPTAIAEALPAFIDLVRVTE